MDLLREAALSWKEITEYRYVFTYGYKKKLYPLTLTFSLSDFPHLAGFQYTKDVSIPNYSSSKTPDRILDGKISFDMIRQSEKYESMIRPRTLLKKERIHIPTNTSEILMDRLTKES